MGNITSIQVLVSTYLDSIFKVPSLIRSLPENVAVLVVHQVPNDEAYDYDAVFPGRRALVVRMKDRGLAKSRNLAASLASADILIPTDDDVRFLPGVFPKISQAFNRRPGASIISFQMLDSSGQPQLAYPSQPFRHSLLSIRRVSSIEIAIRRSAFSDTGLRWDERFGINARFPGGLEQAFMKNALNLNLEAYYDPIPIVEHPHDMTGNRHTANSALFRGAVYAKMFGIFAYPLLVGFALKNASRAGNFKDRIRYVCNLYRGASQYLADEKASRDV